MKPAAPSLKRATPAERVRLVGDTATVDGLPVHTVALVVVDLRDGRVDRDLVEVRAAEARNLRVVVRVNSAGEQRIVREVDPGNDVRRAECDLLRLREEVIRIAIEHHAPDGRHRHELLRNDLGGVEDVEAEFFALFLREKLEAEFPFGKRSGLDGLPKITPVKVRVGSAIFTDSSQSSEWVPATGRQWNFTKVDLPCAFRSRNVCTPKPCIMRKLRGSVRSDIAHISMCVDSGINDTKSQNVSCADAACGIAKCGSGFAAWIDPGTSSRLG